MADQPVTKEKLINADKDLQTIEDFIKKPKDETVTTRFGDEIMTLKGLEEEVKKSGGYFKRYTTLAAANADIANIPVDAVVKVTSAADGGDYEKKTAEATSLTKSGYDVLKTITDLTNPLMQDRDRLNKSKHYLEILDILGKDKLFTPLDSKFISHPSGEILPATSTKTLAVSPLYVLPDIRQDISIVGYGVVSVALYALYDKGMHLIGTSRGNNEGQQQFDILASEIPVNAAYIRYTYNSVSEHSLTGAEIAVSSNLKHEIVSESIPASISSSLKDLEYSLQYPMTERTYIRMGTGESLPTGSFPNLTSSPFIELLNPKLDIEVAGFGQVTIALYAFYNSDKEFITASTGGGSGFKKHIIPASDIPANAKYIRYTGDILNNSYVTGGVKLKSFDTYFQDIIDGSAGGENPIGTIAITGASLAFDANDWFGIAVSRLGVSGINKARSGYGSPTNDGNEIWKDTFFTPEEFEDIDIFAFQYANVEGIADTQDLLPRPQDYTEGHEPTPTSNRIKQLTEAQAMDFILKTLQEKCYAQKDNPESKWYGSQHGKPLRLMFVTHWHDGRTENSASIRVLAKRWGAALCEFDTKIGFSKDQPLPDGTQVSTLYAQDTHIIDGVEYGWHPKRGYSSAYIQNRMGVIFAQSIKESFGY
ncbi:DUF5040 domain-containing protein [Acinetobacter variabilis]|uniref:DUF5040 domain-containing protein n=1 Tax=Acinetobacter variabilis TaxID=70346 RepID=UPI00289DE5F8|nr:DUF5040 domain-containing protein [Acinetobacter variabilis]